MGPGSSRYLVGRGADDRRSIYTYRFHPWPSKKLMDSKQSNGIMIRRRLFVGAGLDFGTLRPALLVDLTATRGSAVVKYRRPDYADIAGGTKPCPGFMPATSPRLDRKSARAVRLALTEGGVELARSSASAWISPVTRCFRGCGVNAAVAAGV